MEWLPEREDSAQSSLASLTMTAAGVGSVGHQSGGSGFLPPPPPQAPLIMSNSNREARNLAPPPPGPSPSFRQMPPPMKSCLSCHQ